MAGVRECADNNGGQSEKRSHEATQRVGAQENAGVENGLGGGGRCDISAYIGIRTGLSLLRGPAIRSGPSPMYGVSSEQAPRGSSWRYGVASLGRHTRPLTWNYAIHMGDSGPATLKGRIRYA